MRNWRLALLTIAGFSFSLSAAAQEWPRFRGPNGTGVSDAELPSAFTDKQLTWKTELPGDGHSSPVLWGDRIFLTCCEAATAQRSIVCVNSGDGKIRWTRQYPSMTYRQHKDNSYASSTPAADADHVYVCWSTPQEYALHCLDHDGKEIWKTALGPYTSQHGSGTSPIVLGDLVILGNDQEGPTSFLIALDRKTGQEKWKVARNGTSMAASTPVIYHDKNGVDEVIFTQRTQGITSIDGKTGKVLWATEPFGLRTIGSPFVAGDLVIGTCGEGIQGGTMIATRPEANTTPQAATVWKSKQFSGYVPTPVVKGDLAFIWTDVGVVTCIKWATNEKVWQEKVGGAYYCSPVIAKDKLICVSKAGEVVVLSASDKFELLGKSQLGELSHATPAIANGRIYFRTLKHLICVGGKTAA